MKSKLNSDQAYTENESYTNSVVLKHARTLNVYLDLKRITFFFFLFFIISSILASSMPEVLSQPVTYFIPIQIQELNLQTVKACTALLRNKLFYAELHAAKALDIFRT